MTNRREPEFSRVLTVAETAGRLGISAVTLHRMRQQLAASGLPYVRLSQARIGYRKSDILAYMEARTVGHWLPPLARDVEASLAPNMLRLLDTIRDLVVSGDVCGITVLATNAHDTSVITNSSAGKLPAGAPSIGYKL